MNTEPRIEQKPLGYMGHGAANRLSNAGEVEYVHAARHDDGDRAVWLHPDPAADQLRARIRVLEAERDQARTDRDQNQLDRDAAMNELEIESKRVGEFQTQLDRIPAIPSVPAMPENGILLLRLGGRIAVEVPVCTADSFQQVVMALACAINRLPMARTFSETKVQCAAEWLDAHQPDGWGVSVKDFSVCDEEWQRAGWVAFSIMLPGTAYGIDSKPYPTKRAAEEALARSLGWTGGEKAQGPAVAAPGTARTPPVGSRGGSGTPTPHRATSCEGTAKAPGATGCDVKVDPPQDCSTCMLGEEPDTHPGCVGCHGVEGNPRWQPEKPTKESAQPCRFCGKTVDDVQKLIYAPDGTTICDECTELCWELVHEKIARRDPRPDNCPLPAVGEWPRYVHSDFSNRLESDACGWTVGVRTTHLGLWQWVVEEEREDRSTTYGWLMGIRRTKAGAKRAAERAARQAWGVRNGGAK